MNTRAQKDMKSAADRIVEIKDQEWAKEKYGTLCHKFPIMVRTCGLCQAVAFSSAKAKVEERKEPSHLNLAHQRVLEDVRTITGKTPQDISSIDVAEYILVTRRVLAAWVYYKRFAESILGAKPGEQTDG